MTTWEELGVRTHEFEPCSSQINDTQPPDHMGTLVVLTLTTWAILSRLTYYIITWDILTHLGRGVMWTAKTTLASRPMVLSVCLSVCLSHQNGYQLVTVHTHDNFLVLLDWETRLSAP